MVMVIYMYLSRDPGPPRPQHRIYELRFYICFYVFEVTETVLVHIQKRFGASEMVHTRLQTAVNPSEMVHGCEGPVFTRLHDDCSTNIPCYEQIEWCQDVHARCH